MTTAVQHRRGTTAEHSTFTGLEGEVTIDTTKDTAVIHDGSLAGGYPLAKETLANVNPSTLSAITGAATASDDLFLMYDTSALAMKKISRAELNNAITIEALDTVDINGGTIDGTTIGGTTAAAGLFTTLSASGAVTLSGGTANGVAYLNGSKVLTSGSALTFDGTTLANSTSGTPFSLNRTGAGTALIELKQSGTVGGYIGTSGSNDIIFFSGAAAELMRLTSTGLGIGTSSPRTKLDVYAGEAIISNGTAGTPSTGGTLWLNTGTSGTLRSAAIKAISTGTSNDHSLLFYTNAGAASPIERLRIDSSGNLGLGVTPSAWNSLSRAFQFGTNGIASLESYNSVSTNIANNYYRDSGGQKYATTAAATMYSQFGGVHYWYTAPSGTAGTAISFTQAMTLDASGKLLLGTSAATAGTRLEIADSSDSAFTTVLWGADKSTEYFAFGVAGVGESRITAGGAGTTSNGITFYTAASGVEAERARIDSSGHLIVPNGVTLGTAVGTYNAANTLDDYEEGTWTPVVRGNTTNGTYTYSDGFAKYTKIGNQVTIAFALTNITEVSAGTGYIQIAGLPFAKSGSAYFCGSVRYQSLTLGVLATSAVIEFIGSGITDVLYLRGIASGYGGIDVNISGITSGATDISATVTYTV